MPRNRYQALSKLEKRTFWIIVTMAVLFAIFSATLIDTLLGAPNFQYALVNALPFTLTIFALISALLFLSNRVAAGSVLLQVGIIIGLLLIVTQAEGFGLPAAFIIFAVTIYIPVQTLHDQLATYSLWGGIIATIAAIILDAYWTGGRVPALTQDVISAIVLSVVLALILITTTALQFNGYTIRTKLLIISLGAGLISIVSVAIFTTLSIRTTLTDQTFNALASAAKQAIGGIDTYLSTNIDAISAEAQNPQIEAFLQSSSEDQRLDQDAMLATLNAFAQRDPKYIVSYTLINEDGVVVADTDEAYIGTNEIDQDYFVTPHFSGNSFISSVRYSSDSSSHEFHISAPVNDSNGRFLGILTVQFRSTVLNEILENNNELAGPGSYGILFDEYDIILAHGINPEWISRTPIKPPPDIFVLLKSEGRILNSVNIYDISLDIPDFLEKLQNVSPSAPYFTSTDLTWGTPVEVGVATSSTTNYKLVYIQPQEVALATVNQQQKVIVSVGTITGVILLLLVLFATRTITNPLVNLSSVAEDVASGNLSARAYYEINDELGTLAKAFNRMTSQLQDTLGGLERRVSERTADLEMARLLSERRAQELQSISEISRTISTEQRLDILLPLITRLVSERFNFYHVGIFFIDEARRYAFLQAANSEGGQKMLARGHRLELGTGLVGTAAQTGKSRIALDVGADASFFNNPDLPATHSEMVLPLNIRGRTIGALDIQSTKQGAFTESDANTLGILADQVAIAIENARLFGETQLAREEAEELYAQVLSRDWNAFVKQEEKIGYRKTGLGGRRISKPVETEEIREALSKGQVVVMEGKDNKEQPSIAVPVKLRGQTIGVLNIKAPTKNRRWSKDEVTLIQAVSDRLALALDNVRLLQESQRRAAKEAKIGEVTAKIGASINMNNVLQTAVEELGKALPGSEVVIQFSDEG